MSNSTLQSFQKASLITLLQLTIILISYLYIISNHSFTSRDQLDLHCMNVSDYRKVCLSVFERNESLILTGKSVDVTSINNREFVTIVMESPFYQVKDTKNKDSYEYFHLINYGKQLNSLNQVQIDTEVKQVQQFLNQQKSKFISEPRKNSTIQHQFKKAIFYFLLQNNGPVIPQPEIMISYPTYQVVHYTNLIWIFQSLCGVFLVFGLGIYKFYQHNNKNEALCESQQLKKTNRISQFLLNFGINQAVFYLTIHKFWAYYGLNFINQFLGFSKVIVPMAYGNTYENFFNLFPEWLLLSFFIYQVAEKYLPISNVLLVVLSGLFGSILFLLPLNWPQFIFEIHIIVLGLWIILKDKKISPSSTLFFTAMSLSIMLNIKIWYSQFFNQSNDFIFRFTFNQVFILHNILTAFFSDELINIQQNRKYIPYEQYSMEEEAQFDQHESIPHAQKI